MSLVPQTLFGYYDENGIWQRQKFCTVSCGALCDCMPPNGQFVLTGADLEEHQVNFNNVEDAVIIRS